MNWEGELLDLYEKNRSKAGVIEYKEYEKNGKKERVPYLLLPLFHTTAAAQIEVTIDEEGNFLDASKVSEEDKLTVIPMTEKSGSRTAGKAPHPLCDNLQYVAGDYANYVKSKAEDAAECYEMYIAALEQWHLSEYAHDKADAVYRYLKKKTLIRDLAEVHVLTLNEGILDDTAKIQNVTQEKAFVRFIVRQGISEEISEEACWKDVSLQERFIAYCHYLQKEKELDYLTGKLETPSYFHSKKIRSEGDGAKLISSNDKDNYTFRGRFASKEEAFSIGGETSQKIHNALKWMIRKQGRHFDSLTFAVWESNLSDMAEWDADTETIGSDYKKNLPDGSVEAVDCRNDKEYARANDIYENDMEQTDAESIFENDVEYEADGMFEDDMEHEIDGMFKDDIEYESYTPFRSDGNSITAKQFYQALHGYRSRISNASRMILMAFDAATTGRLALAEYKVLETGRYLENMERWHRQCSWVHTKFKNGKKMDYIGIPGVKEIADFLYGSDSDAKKFLTIHDKNGKRLYAEISKRLLPCIWDGRNLPYDLVMHAVGRASAPQTYKERYNWEKVLALACSFVKKYRYDGMKEEWNVALDKNCKNRDYLYGRLLAIADRVEYRTFEKERDSGRETNAKRYMSMFSQRPFETWKVIEENLQPYLNKLKAAERRYYENLLDGVCDLFEANDFCKNTKLDGLYLLGFHSQSFAMKNVKYEEN